MRKNIFLLKKVKSIFFSINSFFITYFDRLNLKNKKKRLIVKKNIYIVFLAISVFFISYLSIPSFYNNDRIQNRVKEILINNYKIEVQFSKKINYSFLPKPHFFIKDLNIIENKKKISSVKELKIYVSLKNLYNLNKIENTKTIFNEANFDINKENNQFFKKFFINDNKNKLVIFKDSNIFFKGDDNELLFIQKIINSKFYYNDKKQLHTMSSLNKIFNLKYSLDINFDSRSKLLNTQIISKDVKLNFKNEFDLNKKKGTLNLAYLNKKKSVNYILKDNFLSFYYPTKKTDQEDSLKGLVNFKPFSLNLKSNFNKLDLTNLLNQESLFISLLKSKIIFNKNLSIYGDLIAKKVLTFDTLDNFSTKFTIEKGYLDLIEAKFYWRDYARFKALDNLIFLDNENLILDGKLIIYVQDLKKIFRFFQTPKKFRKKIEKIELQFNYNFDEKDLNILNIIVNNKTNNNLNEFFREKNLEKNYFENRIYLKKFINEILEVYSG